MHTKQIKVKYKQGQLIPTEPLNLSEDEETYVFIEDKNASGDDKNASTSSYHQILVSYPCSNSLLEWLTDPEEDIYEHL